MEEDYESVLGGSIIKMYTHFLLYLARNLVLVLDAIINTICIFFCK